MRFFSSGLRWRGLLGDHVLAARPGRITVREVAGPHELVRIELVGELEGRPVVLEGERDVLAEILRRQALQLLALHPVAMALVGVVHAIHEMRRPACVGFDADDAQLGMPFEHAGIDQHAHDVLAAADDRQEAVNLRPARLDHGVVAARRQDVEAERQLQRNSRLPERVERGIVVVLLAGIARHHDAAKTHRLDALEILDAFLDRADAGLAHADQALRIVRDVGLQPAIVGVEARLLVVEVGMIAEQHADAGIDHLGGNAVLVLVGEPLGRIPAAAMQIVEPGAADADVLGVDAGRGDQAHRHRRLHALDDVDVAHPFLVDDMRRPLPPRRVDMVDIAVRRLGDVRIGRNRTPVHLVSSCLRGRIVGRRGVPPQAGAERPFRRAATVEPVPVLWHTPPLRGLRPPGAAVAQW